MAGTWQRRSPGNPPRNEFYKREYEDIDVEHFAYDKLFQKEPLENVAGKHSGLPDIRGYFFLNHFFHNLSSDSSRYVWTVADPAAPKALCLNASSRSPEWIQLGLCLGEPEAVWGWNRSLPM